VVSTTDLNKPDALIIDAAGIYFINNMLITFEDFLVKYSAMPDVDNRISVAMNEQNTAFDGAYFVNI
jgi:hypothetical protein